jgi:hypothetical protein
MAADPSRTIDGREYTFGRIPPTKSVPLQVQLIKLIGPEIQLLLGQDMAKLKSAFDSKDIAALGATLAPVAFGAIQNADGAEVMRLMVQVFAYTKCNGNVIDEKEIDPVFGNSDPGTMWKVFFEGLKVNYSRFFPVAPSDSSQPTTG